MDTQQADNIMINRLASNYLQHQGHQVTHVPAESSQAAYELLKNNQADAYLSTWIPIESNTIKPYLIQGEVKTLGKVLANTQTGLAANKYAEQLDILNISTLGQHGDALDYRVYLTERDQALLPIIQRAFKRSHDNLPKFSVINISQEALSKRLQQAERQKKPLVFFTRKIDFLAQQYATHFLFDLYGKFESLQTQATIYSSIRYPLSRECPELTKHLQAFHLSAPQATHILHVAQGDKQRINATIDKLFQTQKHDFGIER